MRTSRMRNSRQITVLRSLFKTLHPILESGLAPARRLLTSSQEESPDPAGPHESSQAATNGAAPPNRASRNAASGTQPKSVPTTTPTRKASLTRTLTDEHLVVELENITRQISQHGHTAHTNSANSKDGLRASPQRGQRHYSRDTLISLLEEAKVRIQVLETELELARGFDESIPMLTDEWPEQRD